MRTSLRALAIALLLTVQAAPTLADDDGDDPLAGAGRAVGCAFALSATSGMPGWVFVRASCDQATNGAPTQADDQAAAAAGAAAAEQGVATGCAIAEAQTTGTPGAAYVQWACARAESAVQGAVAPNQSVVVPPSPPPPVDGRAIGCARALAAVSGTAGEPYVRAHCG